MLLEEAEGAGEEGEEEEEEGAVVLEVPLAVSGAVPEDVSVVAVAPVGLAVAIDPGVVDSAAGFASSLLCTPRKFCDCEC